MTFIEILKWAWEDAKDNSHSCLNNYSYEKGNQLTLFTPKSERFEEQCFSALAKVYGCGLKKILVDLLIPNLKGHTTQLDLIFVNRNGIYVIECKDFSCNINGNDTDKWIRKEFNGKLNKIENPIIQNTNHIKCLQRLFPDYPDDYFKNIVVFANTCNLEYINNTILPYDTKVINYNRLKGVTKKLIKHDNTIFSDEDIYNIYNELSQYARYSEEDRIKHLEYVKSLQN